MNKAGERLLNGLVKENPTFVLMLGMCPTLAVTVSAMNGLGMGLTTTVVLTLSNVFISLLRGVIPNRVRIPAFIVIIASFVTMVQMLLQAYLPSLNDSLGVYIPLIVVNCIILGRAESYAYHNPVLPSLFDGLGMGLGFSVALTCIGGVRELLGAGKLFGAAVLPDSFIPIRIFGQAPGAFFVLAMLVALQNYIKEKRKAAGKPYEKIGSGCSQDCMSCSVKGCEKRFYDADGRTELSAQKAPGSGSGALKSEEAGAEGINPSESKSIYAEFVEEQKLAEEQEKPSEPKDKDHVVVEKDVSKRPETKASDFEYIELGEEEE